MLDVLAACLTVSGHAHMYAVGIAGRAPLTSSLGLSVSICIGIASGEIGYQSGPAKQAPTVKFRPPWR